jgi:RimJ/RimL family protein N-acetyltransferase
MGYHYSSSRLEYRAVRPKDANFFSAVTDDTIGYIMSSLGNIHMPNDLDASEYMTYCKEKCLVGVVVWLKHPTTMSVEEKKKRIADAKEEGKENMVEMWGEAIGEIHLAKLDPKYVHHRNTEIGLSMLPEWQGKGYGSEAITWALDYAFRLAGLHRVRIRYAPHSRTNCFSKGAQFN